MPFLFRDTDDNKILLFTQKEPTSTVWKIFYKLPDGTVKRLNTGFDEGVIECSPTAWCDETGFHISFVAGDITRQPYRLYRMDGATLDTLSMPVAMRIARTGFVYKDRLVAGEIQDVVHIHDTSGDYNIEIPGAFLYRVSYQSDAPDKLLISGSWIGETSDVFCLEYDLRTNEQRFLECDGLPAYKCCILGDEILYAEKTGNDFESRSIRRANHIHGITCKIASKNSDTVSDSGLQTSKRCGCRLSKREKLLHTGEMSRPSCLACVEKHLGAAYVILAEIHSGYMFRLRFIGHLHEAEDESQEFPRLNQAIRDARKNYQHNGVTPDWELLANMATEVSNAR
ncbi:MAG: hypothetical protein ACRC2T_11595 [Thermoguttaceae bacterium]